MKHKLLDQLMMDDAEFYTTYFNDMDEVELTTFFKIFPEFMTNLPKDDIIKSLKTSTYQKIVTRIREL